MQGIALGRCRKSDGMIFYSPHTKELYVSSDYKLNEGHHTPTMFNLRFDGGIFLGLHNHYSSKNSTIEPLPQGTPVSFPTMSNNNSKSPVFMLGDIISVPIPMSPSQLPLSDRDSPPYTIKLVDGCIHEVSPDFLEKIVVPPSPSSSKILFPTWLGHSQKVMFLHDGMYLKGYMEWDWIIIFGVFVNGRKTVRSYLVLFCKISIMIIKNKLMMDPLFLGGTLVKVSTTLLILLMSLLVHCLPLLPRGHFSRLYTLAIPTKTLGWHLIRRSITDSLLLIPLMLFQKKNIISYVAFMGLPLSL